MYQINIKYNYDNIYTIYVTILEYNINLSYPFKKILNYLSFNGVNILLFVVLLLFINLLKAINSFSDKIEVKLALIWRALL